MHVYTEIPPSLINNIYISIDISYNVTNAALEGIWA
jgi:hypothetical protein